MTVDIGKEGAPFVIEPLVEPVPGKTTPAPVEPDYQPVEPDREKVPA